MSENTTLKIGIDDHTIDSALVKLGLFKTGESLFNNLKGPSYDEELKRLQVKKLKRELNEVDLEDNTIENVFAANVTRGLADQIDNGLAFLRKNPKPGSVQNVFARAFKIKF